MCPASLAPTACSRVPTVLHLLQVPPAPPRPKSNMERTWAPHELQKSALGVCRELLTCRNLKHWSHVGFCIFLGKKTPIFVPPDPDWTRHTSFLWRNDDYLPSWNDQNWQKASAYHSYFRSPSPWSVFGSLVGISPLRLPARTIG